MTHEESPPEDGHTETYLQPTGAPSRIGNYRILQRIGRGGMGEVYLAEQDEPRRRVALKIIKLGMDTDRIIARFEVERQVLAMMNHPNVAKVFDADSTQSGRPFFVMEYVEGAPITDFCDRHRLTTKERLELFMQVCDGVQHAHQNAIIHRDIKPSNVLVTTQDGKRVPKLIDFGVAKATAQRLTERTLYTQFGQLIGTPEYMSPEQAEMSPEGVDTRTDVYSLGVLLYELLVGALPFDSRELRQAGLDEIRQRIRQQEPSKPSARLSTLGPGTPTSARNRRTDPHALARELRGDLDWITMKALDKDRTRRYGSPGELAADIKRYLENQPVLAGPPSLRYRARKFVRRHRAGVAVASAAVASLAVFALTMSFQAARIAHERDRANQEAERANREAAKAGEVSDFLKGLFRVSDPSESRGNSIRAREILDRGRDRIERELAGQPETRADLSVTIGEVYMGLGLYNEAEQLFADAVATHRETLGDEHPQTLISIGNQGLLYEKQGRFDEAEPLIADVLETRRRVLGADHPQTLASLNNLALLRWRQGRYDEAESLYREVSEGRRRILGPDHPDTLGSLNGLAQVVYDVGRRDEAVRMQLDVLMRQRRTEGDDHPATLASMNNLGVLYQNMGRYDEAEATYREALEIRLRVLGPDHPSTLKTWINLANLRADQGRYGEAEKICSDTLERVRRTLGDEHPDTLAFEQTLANLYWAQSRFDEAEPLYDRVLEGRRRVLGENHPDTISALNNVGLLRWRQGKSEEALGALRQALEAKRRVLGDDHSSTLNTMNNLSGIYLFLDRFDEAEPVLREALELMKRALGPDHPLTLDCAQNLIVTLASTGRPEEARPILTELIAQRRQRAAADKASPRDKVKFALLLLECEPEDLRDPGEALTFALQANEQSGFEHPVYLDALAMAYERTGNPAKASETLSMALERLPDGDSRRPGLRERIAELAKEDPAR